MQSLRARISAIREERNTDRRISMLDQLNNSLPEHAKLKLPSLITNAYVRTALDIIEERMIVTA
ncbi:MAG TPA: hypothetical protein VJL54_04775 [Nitrososphaera sp.]|jgi:hypothetical protein|nr:hypothetical protein [Nitrososphaera sp.]